MFVIVQVLVWLCWALWLSGHQSDTPGSTLCIVQGLVWLCWALWPSGRQSDTPGSTLCVCDCLWFSLVVLGFVVV